MISDRILLLFDIIDRWNILYGHIHSDIYATFFDCQPPAAPGRETSSPSFWVQPVGQIFQPKKTKTVRSKKKIQFRNRIKELRKLGAKVIVREKAGSGIEKRAHNNKVAAILRLRVEPRRHLVEHKGEWHEKRLGQKEKGWVHWRLPR